MRHDLCNSRRVRTMRPELDTLPGHVLLAELLDGPRARRREVAREVWRAVQHPRGLAHTHPEELRACGLTAGEVRRVLAALRLGRVVESARPAARIVDGPDAAYAVVAPWLAAHDRERFVVVVLDARHRPERVVIVAEGSVERCPVDPREVFRPALGVRGAAIVVAHNHPSGDPTPSRQDLELTARLEHAGEILGVPVLDHLVVGRAGEFVSVKSVPAVARSTLMT